MQAMARWKDVMVSVIWRFHTMRLWLPPVRERGQGMVEYALILVLVSIVVIVILLTMGRQIRNVFSNVVGALG
jgi:pilus assembly protein Flp/PilA